MEEKKIKEACGVFGIYDFAGNDVCNTIYYGSLALQHRGQESCGIAVSNTNIADSLDYLKTERLKELVDNLGICKGCFIGKYPIKLNK